MAAANKWWRRKQKQEIDREQARADLAALRDQIDEDIYERLLHWIDRREPDYLRLAQEKIESLMEYHRFTWGQLCLPEEGSGQGLDEIL